MAIDARVTTTDIRGRSQVVYLTDASVFTSAHRIARRAGVASVLIEVEGCRWSWTAKRPVDPSSTQCQDCGGVGARREFAHVHNGLCFTCRGTGKKG